MDTEKYIAVQIPIELKSKIDDGEYTLLGTQVRDKSGRIVCNLKALEKQGENYYSPQIFVSFQQYSFVSATAISTNLRQQLDDKMRSLSSMEEKLDRMLSRQTSSLYAEVQIFNEHFENLGEKSNLTDEKQAFSTGVKAAVLGAAMDSYFKEYIDSVEVWSGYDNESMTYGEYKREPQGAKVYKGYKRPSIEKTKFKRFSNFDANPLAYAFLEVLNGLNLLSINYNKRVYSRYLENLEALDHTLRDLLAKLVDGLGKEGSIYDMMYVLDRDNKFEKIDILRIQKARDQDILQSLISRSFGKENSPYRDQERLESIYNVIDILEEISNLKERAMSLESIKLENSPEVKALQYALFCAGES